MNFMRIFKRKNNYLMNIWKNILILEGEGGGSKYSEEKNTYTLLI